MTHPKEPPRLIDPAAGTSESVRAILRAGRGEAPDADQIARLAARLPLGLPPPGGGGQAPPPGTIEHAPTAVSSLLPSALTGAALAVAVVIGVAWRGGDAASGRDPRSAAPSSVAVHDPALPQPDAPKAPVKAPRIDPTSTAIATPTSAAAAVTAPPAAATNSASSPPSSAEPLPLANGAAFPAPNEPETEVHLLQRAQDALGADPSRALALAAEHERRFAGGALAQERELIAVAALAALGRKDEARARGARFLEAHPRSAHRRRIEAIVGVDSSQKNEPPRPPTP